MFLYLQYSYVHAWTYSLSRARSQFEDEAR
jgi:hypothetical protein